ncbi:MAG: prephenate dehydrogenase, partial [Oscillospiraceae bacterium]
MKIAIIGLGLIGGSLAKSIKKNTNHTCYGIDKNEKTVLSALTQEAIDEQIDESRLNECDISIVCLYPEGIIDYIIKNKNNFKKGSIVIDSCGVKSAIVNSVEQELTQVGVNFLGCHPMAGREFSGFEYSVDNLFDKASFIMTPTENTDEKVIATVSSLAKSIGFAKCVISDPQEHDRIIAFTSQLAHVVS